MIGALENSVVGRQTPRMEADGNMVILNRTVQVGFADKIRFDQRPEGSEGIEGSSGGRKQV